MSAAKWGLLSGIAGGVGQGFQMSLQARLDEAKEKRLREWQAAQMQEQRAFAQEEKLSDRTYQEEQQTKQFEREDSRRAVNEKVIREDGKQITMQENAKGEVIGRKEAFLDPDKSKGFGMSRGVLYNRDTGEYEMVGGTGGAQNGPKIQTITDENGVKQLVQVVTDENGMASYVPVQAMGGQAQPQYAPEDIAAAEEQAGKSVGGSMWGMVGGMDGDLIEQYGGEDAAIAYQKQKILAEKQGKVFDMAPSAWKRQYLGEDAAPETSARNGNKPSFDSMVLGQEKPSTGGKGLLQPKEPESLFDIPVEAKEPWGVTKGKEAIQGVKDYVGAAPEREAAAAKQTLDVLETRVKSGAKDGLILQELNKIYTNKLVSPDQRERAKNLYLKINAQ